MHLAPPTTPLHTYTQDGPSTAPPIPPWPMPTPIVMEPHLAPARQPRRYHIVRRVPLVRGNLVLDCPVPIQYLNAVPHRDRKEFTHMRYTAVTCDPAEFPDSYTLRQELMSRSTELFICITMYNVNDILMICLERSLSVC